MASKIPWLPLLALCSFWTALASAVSGQEPLKGLEDARGYNPGEPIPVTCLNRTMYTNSPTSAPHSTARSEERRVGKECRSRESAYNRKEEERPKGLLEERVQV